ncbi:hypothetical protein TPHA_0I00130 [Tetrapisispora phaffii CBS 4417]|uniref:Uncharacterized protein n=1 Tax=Tetrapisispora phaffii (strain ATCC 24235 / CBS 4417 / NBRC 1672 / NRRL Y-8282 / UCD 70-5) TaxID=1071381 RepID=G8BX92_TETPH|nr:hypothetical protein TPHA_0I00130 [Tetrapisispora phaffii CBS 4417]CCE64520.1 hypothetical protein TPHA_0I00130 [Tetrapisispora phaffii CBS 4417]
MAKKKRTSRAKSSKRALNALELAEKAVRGYGTDSDSDDNGYRGRGRGKGPTRRSNVVNLLKRVGGKEDDDDEAAEDSFEDEELDSDEAFGSGEDFDVMDSKFSQTLRDLKKKNGDDYELDIDEEGGYTSIDDDDLMSLSQVWDMDEKPKKTHDADDAADDITTTSEFKLNDDDISSQSSESSSSDDSDDGSESDPFDEISEDENDIHLKTITDDLSKNDDGTSKKRLDNYADGEEDEFNLPSISRIGISSTTSMGLAGNKLNLADMMSVVEDKEAVSKASLLKSDNKLTVSIPLPQRIQQRNERKAAYEISKDEVNKWNDVVKQNRRSEYLSFPLNPKVQHNEATTFSRADGKSKTELEVKVNEILKDSSLADPEKEQTFEQLATATVTPEEMQKRTAERRLMRELMFREERKSKRLKKIKSKAFHRIKKKEMLRNKEMAGLSDESDTDMDIVRAKERMTLKHKSNNKWAKDMVKHGMSNDANTREEIEEMFKQGEKLRQKILDRKDGESDEDKNLSDYEREQEDEDSLAISDPMDAKAKFGKSGVMNMAFMKNAEAREREDNKKLMERLRDAEASEQITLFASDDENENNGENVRLNNGRRIYTPGNLQAKEEMDKMKEELLEEQKVDESRLLANRLSTKKNVKKDKTKADDKKEKSSIETSNDTVDAESNANPWLDGDSDDEAYAHKQSSKVSVIEKDSTAEKKALYKLAKSTAKSDSKSKSLKNKNRDEDLLLDMEDSNRLQIKDAFNGSDDDDASDSKGFMFKQQDVIAEAFAGDNVVAEFEEDKKRTVIDEDDKEEDVTMPGWGDWAGAGARPKKKRKFIKKIQGVVTKDNRKDKNLKNVIINEKQNKKNSKYQSSSVPFPYENKEQYERSLRMPIGQEWTSRASHQKLIKPRITTKPGEVIDPLKTLFK